MTKPPMSAEREMATLLLRFARPEIPTTLGEEINRALLRAYDAGMKVGAKIVEKEVADELASK